MDQNTGSRDSDQVYSFQVPDRVRAPEGVTEVRMKFGSAIKDFQLMEILNFTTKKMVVSPELDVQDCHLTFFNFVASCGMSMISSIKEDAKDQWDSRRFDDDGNLSFEFDDHELKFRYPTPKEVIDFNSRLSQNNSVAWVKKYMSKLLLTPPASLHQNLRIWLFCDSIMARLISDGIEDSGEDLESRLIL